MASKKRRKKRTRGPGLVATLRDPDKIRIAYIIAGLALVFGGSLGFGASQCGSSSEDRQAAQTDPSDPIAEIGDREITYLEFSRDYEQQRRRAEASAEAVLRPPEFYSDLKYRVLRQMIDMEYFDIRAHEQGINITEDQIEEQMEQYRTSLVPPAVEEEDRSILQRIQDALGSVKQEKEFERALRRIDPTMSVDRLRGIIRQELMAQQYVTQLSVEKEREIRDELVQRGEEIRDEIIAGRDFADAAMEHSDHEESASAGGLIPVVTHDSEDVPQAVIETTFQQPVGEISLPVPTNEEGFTGVWIVKVISSQRAEGEEWESRREAVRQQVLEEKRTQYAEGELELEEGENITVTEEEVVEAYEEATIRTIYLKAEDPMRRVTQAVHDDEATMNIVIHDPEIRAMHHAVDGQWDLAAADYHESLQNNAARLNEDETNLYAVEMEEARIRYLIANLWSTRAFSIEADWFQNIWQEYQANPEAFGDSFPELPESIKSKQQGYFVLALKNLDRAISLEDKNVFYRLRRASIDLARAQLTGRLIEDLKIAHEFSSSDFQVESQALDLIRQAVAIDDRALEEAGGERPETMPEVVFPEDEMGITLPQLDAPFIELIEIAAEGTMETPGEDDIIGEEPAIDTSPAETDLEILGEQNGDTDETEQSAEEEIPDYVPDVPAPEPTGPLTAELRTRLEDLHTEVQEQVDILQAEREARQAAQEAQMQQQASQFQQTAPPESTEAPSPAEDAENLLDEGEEVDEQTAE